MPGAAAPTGGTPGPSTGTLPPSAPPGAPGQPPPAYPPGAYPASASPPGSYPPGAYPPGAYPPGAYPPGTPYTSRPKTNGLAIAGFVLSILWLFGLGSLLAVIFGIVALVAISRANGAQRGRGWAIAGLVIGAVGLVLTVVLGVVISRAVEATDYPFGTTVATDQGTTGFTSITVYGIATGLSGTSSSGDQSGTYAAADIRVCVGSAGMPAVDEHLVFFLLRIRGGGLVTAQPQVTTHSPNLWFPGVRWPPNQCQRGYLSFAVTPGQVPDGVRYQGNLLHAIQWTPTGT
jgi:hypothetical protein